MWQFYAGIYLFIGLLISILLWASLVAAKKPEHQSEDRYYLVKDLAVGEKDQSNDSQIFHLPKLSQPGRNR